MVVVFLLFAVGMAAATGFAVVDLEADLASQAEEAGEALAVAQAGLERYLGEHLGIPDDSTLIAMPQGDAVIRARRITTVDAAEGIDLYLIESEGVVVDPVNPDSPARKVVSEYARLHTRPVGRHAAAVLNYQVVELFEQFSNFGGKIRGVDHASTTGPNSCPQAQTEGVPGIVHRGTAVVSPEWDSVSVGLGAFPSLVSGGQLVGVGSAARAFASPQAIVDSVGIRWDILTDDGFPVAFDGSPPNYLFIPSDEYPVVRVRGDLIAGAAWSGRGVLIVTGTLTLSNLFFWDGIVIAGEIADLDAWFYIQGMLIAGMNASKNALEVGRHPNVWYNVCSALRASEALAYFEPVDRTFWQVR